MFKAMTRWMHAVAMAGLLAGAGSANAAFVVETSTSGSTVSFTVKPSEEISLISLELMLFLPDGVFNLPSENAFGPANGKPDEWDTGNLPGDLSVSTYRNFTTSDPPALFTMLVGITRALDISPVTFSPEDALFLFSLELNDDQVAPERFEFTAVPGLPEPIPEPSTYALMIAGLLGLGFIARRRITV